MENIHRFTRRLTTFTQRLTRPVSFRPVIPSPRRTHSSGSAARSGWLLGIAEIKNALPDIVNAGDPVRSEEIRSDRVQKSVDDKMVKVMRKAPGAGLDDAPLPIGFPFFRKNVLPDIVKAGDPVLHEPADEVPPEEIRSERIQKIIDDMVKVMRKVPGVGLAAPQIGIPLRIIVLEDKKAYISKASEQEVKAKDRKPFDLLVVINPKLEKMGDQTAFFFEGCLSVDGVTAVVERHLEVEVSGLDRVGQAIKVNASGWQARIFQHECDHLDGTIYVDKMVPRTFRSVRNLDLPLASSCPKVAVH